MRGVNTIILMTPPAQARVHVVHTVAFRVPDSHCTPVVILGAITGVTSAAAMSISEQRVRPRVPKKLKRRRIYPPATAWSGYASAATTTNKSGGCAELVSSAINHAQAIGSHMRYPPRYTAAMATPTGIKTTAWLVLKVKNKYWFSLRKPSTEIKTARKEISSCWRNVLIKAT